MAHRDSTGDPGVYIIRLVKPAFGLAPDRVIYVGKGDDVDKRVRQELGKAAGAATFFRSIGVLLGKTVIPGSGKNFEFYERQEIARWLEEHTECTIIKCAWEEKEKSLIVEHKPPLNYTYNAQHYYPGLLKLRAEARAVAKGK